MAKKRKLLQQKQKTNKSKPGAPHKPPAKGPRSNAQAGKAEVKSSTAQNTHQRDLAPTLPFSPEDAILLVGEGDLSFSRALVEHHYCDNVTATVLEANLKELKEKYPHVQENVDIIEGDGSKIIYNVDAKKMGPWGKKSGKDSVSVFDRISTQLTKMLSLMPPLLISHQRLTLLSSKFSTFPMLAESPQMSTGRYGIIRSSSSSFLNAPCSPSLRGAPSSSRYSRVSPILSGTFAILAGTPGCRLSEVSASRRLRILGITMRGHWAWCGTRKGTLVADGKERRGRLGVMYL